MQKKLIALAVAGAFAAPAFAATSNVDVYGKIHASVNIYNDEPDGTSNMGLSSNASRIGFKGSEDLGGGLSAIWQVESTVNLDEGGGWGSGRNTFIGLKGNWGTVLGGKHDTPLKLVGRNVDLFGDTQADSRNVMGGGSDTRADNVVAYISPDFSGFSLAVAYTTDLLISTTTDKVACTSDATSTSNTDPTGTAVSHNHSYVDRYCSVTPGVAASKGDKDDNDAYNLYVQYKNGPIYVGAGYGDGDAHENLGYGAHWRLAAAFDMGDFRFVGQYDMLEEDGNAKGDYDAWMLGAQYKMGAFVFKGNYMDGDWDDSDADPNQWTVGVDYNLSKRTTAYLLYADGENVTMGAGAGSSDQVAGSDEDISVISIGMVHSF